MITYPEIYRKALKFWTSQRLLQTELTGETLFPLVFTSSPPSAGKALKEFDPIRNDLALLKQNSKENVGYGYSIEWKSFIFRTLGQQSLPVAVRFENVDDFCNFIGKSTDFLAWKNLIATVLAAQPALRSWLEKYPLRALQNTEQWMLILAVLKFFQTHPRPGLYLRQLPIPGVHTKFIEQNQALLRELLDLVLPPSAILESDTKTYNGDFEARYGLRRDEPLVRFRFLDTQLPGVHGFRDVTVTLGEFSRHPIACRRVFITENKVNGLSFPDVADSIVIFSLGYGVTLLQSIDWLKHREVVYWGDIDTHGFSILSRLRGFLPHVRSMLMDRETLLFCRSVWGKEDSHQRFLNPLIHLTTEENSLFEDLRFDRLGEAVRLEQEHIPFEKVISNL